MSTDIWNVHVVNEQLEITFTYCQLTIVCLSTDANVLSHQLTYEYQSRQRTTQDNCLMVSLIIVCMSTEENVLSCQLTYECQSCQWPSWDYCTLLSIDSNRFVNWRKCSFMSIDMWNVKLVKRQVAITFRPCQLTVACLLTDGNVCPCQLIYGML